jgi:hypothetical protein
MEGDALRAELAAVTSELSAAKTEYASLGARIAGLEARSAALMRAVPGAGGSDPGDDDVGGRYRTDDIVEILVARGAAMSIKEVVAALHDAGRPNESYENVSADLAYLVDRGRITRVGRGVYAAIRETNADADRRIAIRLTQGNIRNGHVYLAGNRDFFPADVFGGANKEGGQGKLLTLTFEGFPGKLVETDIASDKNIFRVRGVWREFFERHGLRGGDKIALERQSDYEYHVTRDR